MLELGLGLPQFETFLDSLHVPNSCVLNKPLFKKMFQEHADLDIKDKKVLKDDVDKIRWLYTLKPSTINIAPYNDALRDYGELAFLQVELCNTKSAERIGQLINRAIPYPLVIFFTSSENKGTKETGEPDLNVREKQHAYEQLAICLADKRSNKADKEKWVVDDFQLSPWLALDKTTEIAQVFLNSLTFTRLPHSNFWQFYQALMDRVQALQCSQISGRFQLAGSGVTQQDREIDRELDQVVSRESQRQQLQQYREIEQHIKKLRAQIKQAEFSQQVVLNTQIKKQELKLKQIAEHL